MVDVVRRRGLGGRGRAAERHQPLGAVALDPLPRPADPFDVIVKRGADLMQVRDAQPFIRAAPGGGHVSILGHPR